MNNCFTNGIKFVLNFGDSNIGVGYLSKVLTAIYRIMDGDSDSNLINPSRELAEVDENLLIIAIIAVTASCVVTRRPYSVIFPIRIVIENKVIIALDLAIPKAIAASVSIAKLMSSS